MSCRISWAPTALEALNKLPSDISERILNKLDKAAQNPHHFLEKLVKIPGFKLRIGDHRLIIDFKESEGLLLVLEVGHRRNIYKKYQTD